MSFRSAITCSKSVRPWAEYSTPTSASPMDQIDPLFGILFRQMAGNDECPDSLIARGLRTPLARIQSAFSTQAKGLQSSFHWGVGAAIIAMSSLTERKPLGECLRGGRLR